MRTVLALLLAAAVLPAAAAAQDLAYSASFQYASGTYIFTEPTRTFSLYSGLTLSAGRLRLGGSIPVVVHNSGAVTLVGGAYLPTGGLEHGAVGARKGGQRVPMGPGSGQASVVSLAPGDVREQVEDSAVEAPGRYEFTLGDPLVMGGIELFRGRGAVRSVEVTASAKPPLNGLDSGVGTGEWDYAIGGAAALALGDLLVFLDATHWWYGDLPELELRDGFSLGAGLGLPLSRSVWLSGMAAATNRIIESAEPSRSASVGLSYRVSDTGMVSLTAGAGLSETSPDYTFSVGWRQSLRPGR